MTERSDEVVKAFDDDNCAALASCEVCGLINEDLFPGSQDFGPSAAETVNHTHDNDPLLQQHLKHQKGMRKRPFGAFWAAIGSFLSKSIYAIQQSKT